MKKLVRKDYDTFNNDELEDYIHPLDEMRMAGFGPRLGAVLIDALIILTAVIILIQTILPFFIRKEYNSPELSEPLIYSGLFMYFIGFPLLGILYRAVFESSKYQGTPGKIAVKIIVVDDEGQRLTFLHALGRNLAKIISGMIFMIGYLFPLWTFDKQALHDQMANTFVAFRDYDLA